MGAASRSGAQIGVEQDLQILVNRLSEQGYIVRKAVVPSVAIPDAGAYQPYVNEWAVYSPWSVDPMIQELIRDLLSQRALTLVSADRLWMLKTAMLQTRSLAGEVWELGVYKGGSALLLRKLLEKDGGRSDVRLRLFDTFGGMPDTDAARDVHSAGDFADTSLAGVKRLIGEEPWIEYRKGLVPETFSGLNASAIRFAHVDLDIYEAIRAACIFLYPRLVPGGVVIFDDYGFWSCPGARAAVDEFFSDKPESPFVLPTGQALVTRLP